MKRKQASGGSKSGPIRKRQTVAGGYIPVRATAKSPYVQTLVRGPPANFQPTGNEIKAIDLGTVNYTFRDVATVTSITLINGIQAGTGFFNRVGSRVELKNIHIRGLVLNSPGSSSAPGILRMMVIYDRQPTGSLPTGGDILLARTQTGATSVIGDGEINLDNRDRFTIIRDVQWYTPTTVWTAGVLTFEGAIPNDRGYSINEFVKLKGLGTHFKSSSNPTTIADIATGALYILWTAEGNDANFVASCNIRLRYEDK